jgi:hypothetical protein
MTIFNAIDKAKSLVKQLSSNNHDEVILRSISKELDNITLFARQLTEETPTNSNPSKPAIKSGCYVFTGEKGFFCPNCYDNTGNKVSTKRLNSKIRVCPQCRASIK